MTILESPFSVEKFWPHLGQCWVNWKKKIEKTFYCWFHWKKSKKNSTADFIEKKSKKNSTADFIEKNFHCWFHWKQFSLLISLKKIRKKILLMISLQKIFVKFYHIFQDVKKKGQISRKLRWLNFDHPPQNLSHTGWGYTQKTF